MIKIQTAQKSIQNWNNKIQIYKGILIKSFPSLIEYIPKQPIVFLALKIEILTVF